MPRTRFSPACARFLYLQNSGDRSPAQDNPATGVPQSPYLRWQQQPVAV